MPLSEKQRKHLRRLAHPRHPLVILGQAGLTDGVVAELARALEAHELVKVSARIADRGAREQVFESLAQRTGSVLVQRVGRVGVYYRPQPLTKIILPDD